MKDDNSGGIGGAGTDPEVLEPEVLPPTPHGAESRGQRRRPGSDRIKFILIGLLLDFLDLRTFGPLGPAGFILGVGTAFVLLGLMDVPMRKRALISLGAGVYCLLPGTEALPLGTLLGALLKFR